MTHDNRLATLLQASLIADSLALPVHWNYDPAVIASEYGRVVELRSPPVKGYHGGQPAGGQTHYGAQALALMDSLGAGHTFDETAFAATWRALWDHYDGYRDGATKATLANLDAGTPAKSAGSTSTDLG
ncbi:MAG: ADP-ribosylglycohydrolase family protein, partial [Candidatus Sericytochromatia bacterium]|nr:ADP-ribosylglycohydrolase family protein [Candidatus Sericytochromatia bacterium]